MRVAVLGAGNGGLATAFDFAQHGHQVALHSAPEYGESLKEAVKTVRDRADQVEAVLRTDQ